MKKMAHLFRVDVEFNDGRRHLYHANYSGPERSVLATANELITEIRDNMSPKEREESKIYLILKSRANAGD